MKVWEIFLKQQEKEFGKEISKQWLYSLKVLKFDARNLYLEAKNPFHIHWFNEYIQPKLKNPLRCNGKPIKIHLSLPGEKKEKAAEVHSKSSDFVRMKSHHIGSSLNDSSSAYGIEATEVFSSDPIASQATFSNFISTAQPLAKKILLESSLSSTPPYNPIFLYGPKSAGKTHLLMAYANQLKEKGKNVFYVHAETFITHVVRAFRMGSLAQFRNTYRNIDALIIDDIDLFSRKLSTQEEFFHTFNTLHTSDKQIILSAASSPHELKEIEERLISRFEWGITLSILEPSFQEKKRILEIKEKELALHLHPSIHLLLLESFSSLSSLLRALEAIALRVRDFPSPLSLLSATEILADLLKREKSEKLTATKILAHVADVLTIKKEEILGRGQSKETTFARHISIYLCRKKLSLSYLEIGRLFSRDHSTAIAAVKEISSKIASEDKKTLQVLYKLDQLLKS
ncbi:MAG: ATP-binding protein [Simkania negevensis]|nr:ATP-binding protein [Simkania negevensis]